jgi:uncharacterized protein
MDFSNHAALGSTWRYKGVPLPFVPYPSDVTPIQTEHGLEMRPLFDRELDNQDAVAKAAIEVERATGPMLLVSGGDDRVWPTKRICDMVVQRMNSHGRDGDVAHLHYPEAGHRLFPWTPPPDVLFPPFPAALGGTPGKDAAAHASAWPHVVAHLKGSWLRLSH